VQQASGIPHALQGAREIMHGRRALAAGARTGCRGSVEGAAPDPLSCPDLIRASIPLRKKRFQEEWLAGSACQAGNDEHIDNSRTNTLADIRSSRSPRYQPPPGIASRAFGVEWNQDNDGIDTIAAASTRTAASCCCFAAGIAAPPANGPYSSAVFADAETQALPTNELAQLTPDRGAGPRPLCIPMRHPSLGGRIHQVSLFDRINAFRSAEPRQNMIALDTTSPPNCLSPALALTFANVCRGAEGLVFSNLARGGGGRGQNRRRQPRRGLRDGARKCLQLPAPLEFFAPDSAG